MPAAKHMPLRTCIACGKIKTQREMVRLVNIAGDGIVADRTGKRTGRGAYICRVEECRITALKGNRLERALRTSMTIEDRNRLDEQLKEFCGIEGK